MITHQAARQAGLEPASHEARRVSGLNGAKTSSECPYNIMLVEHCGMVEMVQAIGVDKIAWMEKGTLPLEAVSPELTGELASLEQKEGNVDILVGLDNSRWLPYLVSNKDWPSNNFRLMNQDLAGTTW
jgi:hypothetical protein